MRLHQAYEEGLEMEQKSTESIINLPKPEFKMVESVIIVKLDMKTVNK